MTVDERTWKRIERPSDLPPRDPAAEQEQAAVEWLTTDDGPGTSLDDPWCHLLPDRSGMYAYVHLARAPGDPERSPREARGKANATAWRKRFAKSTVPKWRDAILEHMLDGRARTFNRIAVELADATADVVFGKAPDTALWQLVAEGWLEYTPSSPVFFRLRPAKRAKTAVARRGGRWLCSGCGTTADVVGSCKGYCQDPTGRSCDGLACPTCRRLHYWTTNSAKPWDDTNWIEPGERVVLLSWGKRTRSFGDVVLELDVTPADERSLADRIDAGDEHAATRSTACLRIGARGVVIEGPRYGYPPSRCPDHDDAPDCTCGDDGLGIVPGRAHVAVVEWELDDGSPFQRALDPAGEGIGWCRLEHDGWVELARAGAR